MPRSNDPEQRPGGRPENRPVLTDPEVLQALAHPVRLDVLSYLMAEGPATASQAARAVGDTPSNVSYHVRALARHGLVEPVPAGDGRTRPWRATITGFDFTRDADADSPTGRGTAAVMAAAVAGDQRRVREYLAHRDQISSRWRAVDVYAGYRLRVTPDELARLTDQLDALIRPLIAGQRPDPPADAEVVTLDLQAFPRVDATWTPAAD